MIFFLSTKMKTPSYPIISLSQRSRRGSAIEAILQISLALLFAATAITASAQTTITSIPFTITKSDTYILDKNLSTSSTGAAITVAASDVVIDLGGHTLKQKATSERLVDKSEERPGPRLQMLGRTVQSKKT